MPLERECSRPAQLHRVRSGRGRATVGGLLLPPVRSARGVRFAPRLLYVSLRGAGRAPAALRGRRVSAAAGSLLFLVLVPGIVAGVIPWLLTRWDTKADFADWLPVQILGGAFIVLGVIVLVEAFARFVFEGLGTPAPVAPTEQLVVGGLYRYVRNPMYLAVGATIVGQGLVLGRPSLFLYAAGFALAVVAFVHWYEEPTLSRQFGQEYETYRRAVPAWWPRRRPWTP